MKKNAALVDMEVIKSMSADRCCMVQKEIDVSLASILVKNPRLVKDFFLDSFRYNLKKVIEKKKLQK